MNTVVIVGGGRWSKEIIKTILNINLKKKIFVITKNKKVLTDWLRRKKIASKVNIIDSLKKIYFKRYKFIVCNKTKNHFNSIKTLIKKRCDIFVEKPLCTSLLQAQKLEKFKKKIFYSRIFSFDNSIISFSKKIDKNSIKEININWHDSFKRKKFGKKTSHDLSISYNFDIMPHILNISQILIDKKKLILTDKGKIFFKNNNKANFFFRLNKIKINCKISRNGNKRIRQIKVICNNKTYFLDFSGKRENKIPKKKNEKLKILTYINRRESLKNMLKAFLFNTKKKKELDFNYGLNYLKINKKVFC